MFPRLLNNELRSDPCPGICSTPEICGLIAC